jgi:hypothetical protein
LLYFYDQPIDGFNHCAPPNEKIPSTHNIEFSCAAASDQHYTPFQAAFANPDGVLGDNCNDLLGFSFSHLDC